MPIKQKTNFTNLPYFAPSANPKSAKLKSRASAAHKKFELVDRKR
ncbi:hypothetical protein CAMRE0001_1890 [Campylobacter rectus RM3267]|uniref:Uncharacterized protein n=1 Tax=Campylobacter rectus RM3267 TaxID=553218 RepID=B9CYQ9_CAMRE|nr:hypothetical protein CAMRE0001_1890 [Campylobacter rectus RM3267]